MPVPGDADGYRSALAAAAAMHPALEHLVPAVAGITMAPTMLTGSSKRNVMPGRASVELDCRILPGTTEADVEREVRERLGDGIPYELDWPEQLVAGSSSPAEGPLFDVCQSFLDTADPGTVLLPALSTGFTDSVYLRAACGTVAYGFSPMLATPADVALAGFHAKDERVHVDDLLLAVRFHEHAARALLLSLSWLQGGDPVVAVPLLQLGPPPVVAGDRPAAERAAAPAVHREVRLGRLGAVVDGDLVAASMSRRAVPPEPARRRRAFRCRPPASPASVPDGRAERVGDVDVATPGHDEVVEESAGTGLEPGSNAWWRCRRRRCCRSVRRRRRAGRARPSSRPPRCPRRRVPA